MGKNQSASNLTNIIKQDASGNITFVSGSTTLMSVSSSGAITTTGNVAGTASYASNAELLDGLDSTVFATTGSNTFKGIQTVNSNLIVTGSTQFGSTGSNTHTFTGSLLLSGSLNGNLNLNNNTSQLATFASNNVQLNFGNYYDGNINVITAVSGGRLVMTDTGFGFHTFTGSIGAAMTSSAKMTITNGGNIGIGTATPSASLHISSSNAIIIPIGTTSQRPSSPLSGMFRINSDTKLPEWYDSYLSQWRSFGGDAIPAEYLVVAGGGGGGLDIGGGGGGGGYQTGTTTLSIGTSYTIAVGAGGPIGTVGSNSTFHSFVSLGGGKGGAYAINNAGTGGSGGGGGGQSQPAAAGTPGQGRDGGSGTYGGGGSAGGGGGGAGAVGGAATQTSAGVGGNGGIGLASSITGSSAYYAGGGGGGQRNFSTPATGGTGGGGNGGDLSSTTGKNGVANTGGGAGGTGAGDTTFGIGGSGIIVIKIPSTNTGTFSSGLTVSTITSVSGFNIYKVTAGTGTVTFS